MIFFRDNNCNLQYLLLPRKTGTASILYSFHLSLFLDYFPYTLPGTKKLFFRLLLIARKKYMLATCRALDFVDGVAFFCHDSFPFH